MGEVLEFWESCVVRKNLSGSWERWEKVVMDLRAIYIAWSSLGRGGQDLLGGLRGLGVSVGLEGILGQS